MNTKFIIGSDHAGFYLKEKIIHHFGGEFLIENRGCFDDNSVHYPDIAHDIASRVNENSDQQGILICGTGIGMSIVANRYKQVRAALAVSPEVARLAKEHNNANVLCLGARFTEESVALSTVRAWLDAQFQYGRHEERLRLI